MLSVVIRTFLMAATVAFIPVPAPFPTVAPAGTATPAPGETPLKEIGRVRTVALCNTVRWNIAPTLLGLIKNDEVIGKGRNAFLKMSDDMLANSPGALELDRKYMDRVVSAMVHNLKVVDTLLDQDKRFTNTGNAGDDELAARMRTQLRAIAKVQHDSLDALSGALETDRLGLMQHEGIDDAANSLNAGPKSLGKDSSTEPTTFIDAAGLPADPNFMDPRTIGKSNTHRNTIYDKFAQYVDYQRNDAARAEQIATPAIVQAADGCRAVPVTSPPPLAPSSSPPH